MAEVKAFEGRVLVIEPDEDWRDTYDKELTAAGVDHDIVEFGVAAKERILEGAYQGVITAGYRQSWAEVIRATKRVGAATVVISGASWLRDRVEAEGAGFYAKAELADKPDFLAEILGWMNQRVRQHQAMIAARNQTL